MRQLVRVSGLALACALIALAASCGRKLNHEQLPTISPVARSSVTLAEVRSRLNALRPPEGVDSELMETLKSALLAALEKRAEGKLVTAPPSGEANRVSDLVISDNNDGTYSLSWHYRNRGDYDQDGTVGVDDITPLATHFGNRWSAGEENSLPAVIDGSGNSVVDIADVTAIAQCFGAEVHHYRVEGADTPVGPWESAVEEPQDAGAGEGRLEYGLVLPKPVATWHQVLPVDGAENAGEPSNPVVRPTLEPLVYSVDPLAGYAGKQYAFSAAVSGAEPLVYSWDFGGGANPTISANPSPSVVLSSAGEYAASVTLTNAYGSVRYEFTISVADARGDWWMFMHDPQHTGRSPYVGPQKAALKWWFDAGSYIESSPTIDAEGSIYVGAWDGSLHAVSRNGELRWSFMTGGRVRSSPAIASNGTLYFGSRDGKFYAISTDGSLIWNYTIGNSVVSSPSVGADGTIYIGVTDGHLLAFNPDGTVKWDLDTGSSGVTSPCIGSDGTVYASAGGSVYAINSDSTIRWRYQTDYAVYSSPSLGEDGVVYIGSRDDYVYAINPDGTLKWRYKTGDEVLSSPAIGTDGTIYIGSRDKYLYALDPDGTRIWSYKTGGYVNSSPAVGADGTIYVGSADHFVHAIAYDGLLKWKHETDNWVESSPAVGADGALYVGGGDFVYAFDDQSKAAAVSVQPTMGEAGRQITLTAEAWGAEPLTYHWDFGGGATPDFSTEQSPTITLGEPGKYSAALAVTNAYGEGTYEFTLESFAQALPGDWCMFGRDHTLSRRSPFVGPQTATLKWRYETAGEIFVSPAIAADGTVYVNSYEACARYAINADGTLKWEHEGDYSGPVFYSPAIGADGTIYLGCTDGNLHAFDAGGLEKWSCDLAYWVRGGPTIGPDGTVYVGCRSSNLSAGGFVSAVSEEGLLLWSYPTGQEVPFSPAIGPDGAVYANCPNGHVYALDADGSLRWRYETGRPKMIVSSPAVGDDGTVYVGSGEFYALNPDGSLKWQYDNGGFLMSSPALGTDGTIYIGSLDHYMYAVNPDGTLRWSYETGSYVKSSPAIGADETIYVGSSDHYMYAINPDGTLKWRYETGDEVSSSPAIAEDGSLYVGSKDHYLYAFRD